MDISVCLVNHNAKDLTLNCIQLIYDKTQINSFEIILVDNSSSDGSQIVIKKRFPAVKLIENVKNMGFAAANNQAISIAIGKYLILLNNDTILKNNALDKMVNFIDKNPKIGILTCKLFNADGKTIQHNCRAFPMPLDTMFGRASLLTRLFPNNPISKKNILSDWNYDSIRDVDWVSGAALMIRKTIIQQIGLLDEKFFMFWEDTDFCLRAKKAGWKVMFLPDAEIIHFTGQGGGNRSLLLKLYTIYQMHRSAYYYFRKHYFKNLLHPVAIFLFFGMITLIFFKSLYAIIKNINILKRRSA